MPCILYFICNPSSCITSPLGYILAAQHFVYHKYTALESYRNFPRRFGFCYLENYHTLCEASLHFYNHCGKFFSNFKNFSNVPTADFWRFFSCNRVMLLFGLVITSFSAIDHGVPLFLIPLFRLLTRKEMWEDFLSSYGVFKNAMVSVKLKNQT